MVDRLSITSGDDFGMATIMARKGVSLMRVGEILGVETPPDRTWTRGNGTLLMGTGPGTLLAQADPPGPFWARELQDRLAGVASVSDQSSAYSVVRLAGPDARTVLQRGAPIDLHPAVFGTGSVAATGIAHIAVLIWQLDDAPTYDVATFRSFAVSFRHWLDATVTAL